MIPRLRIGVVGGAGRVGLPLSLLLHQRNFHVVIIDTDTSKLEQLRQGIYPFFDTGGPELLSSVAADSPTFSDDHQHASSCDVVILAVGTPVDEHLNPRLSPVFTVIEQIQPYLRDGQVLILRSTVFPGTSDRIVDMLRSAGLRVSVSFCPERVTQGHALREHGTIPQIISGSDDAALRVARTIFGALTPDLVEMSMVEAELAKLFTNAWRYIRFAVANQFFMIAAEHGVDFNKIRDGMRFKYPRAADLPQSGFAAGPCLFKDTMQLSAFSPQYSSLGQAAMLVNETLPNFLVEQAKRRDTLRGMTVGILGMAFKPDSDDKRESLAYKLRKLLTYEGARVLCTDPRIDDPDFVGIEHVLDACRLIFVGCPHSVYRSIVWRDQTVIDCWGIVESAAQARVAVESP